MTYYWKKNGDTYHWHYNCTHVPVNVRNHPEWVASEEEPSDKEKCNECKEKIKDKHRVNSLYAINCMASRPRMRKR